MSRLILLPSGIFSLIIILITCLLFLGGLMVTRRFSRKFQILGTDSMEANLLIRLAQTVFAVLLGFVVITIWVDYDEMSKRTSMEATTLGNLYRDCRGLGPEEEEKIQKLTIQYVDDIVNDAWPKMSLRQESQKAWLSFNVLYGQIIRYQPRNSGEEIVLRKLFEHLNELANYRRLRHIRNNIPKIPGLFWGLIIVSCSVTIISSFFFHMKNKKVQVIMTTLLGIMVGLIFSAIILMSYPYRSSLKISPYPFQQLLQDVFPTADITNDHPRENNFLRQVPPGPKQDQTEPALNKQEVKLKNNLPVL